MIKKFVLITIVILIFSGCRQTDDIKDEKGFSVTDDLGEIHTFNKTPSRVITLAPNLTEMIFALELSGKLVGNTTYCNYPEESKNVEKVGDILSVNYEKLLSLKSDLILITVEGNTKASFDKLKDLGLKIFISNPRDYNGIKKTFRDFGRIFDKSELAESKISVWDKTVDSINTISDSGKNLSALFLVSIQPIMSAGPSTFINQFLLFSHIRNVTEDLAVNYPFLSREEVIKQNPDFIFHTQHNYLSDQSVLDLYPEWKDLKAVKNNMIFYVNPDIYFRPGPRFAEALKDFNSRISVVDK